MKTKTYILWALIIVVLIVAGFVVVKKVKAPIYNLSPIANNLQQENNSIRNPISNIKPPITSGQEKTLSPTFNPIDGALSRITKKPFGIFVTSKNSPVQPERFTGYHTGADLEITSEEQDMEVSVKTLCAGKLLLAKNVDGYGGVAVESCTLDGQEVTVAYGHLNLDGMKTKVGQQLSAGDFLANLGKGFSSQTDGERKHLHLGIHKGTVVNILGYVQNKNQLNDWMDPSKYLQ